MRQPSEWNSPRRNGRGSAVIRFALPRLEDDRPAVLDARSMLREQTRPVLRVGADRVTTGGSHAADLVVGQHGADRPRALVLKTRPVVVARDAQDPDAARAEWVDVAVTEIEPEQVSVVGGGLGQRRIAATPAAGCSCFGAGCPVRRSIAPLAQSGARDPRLPADPIETQPGGKSRQGACGESGRRTCRAFSPRPPTVRTRRVNACG